MSKAWCWTVWWCHGAGGVMVIEAWHWIVQWCCGARGVMVPDSRVVLWCWIV